MKRVQMKSQGRTGYSKTSQPNFKLNNNDSGGFWGFKFRGALHFCRSWGRSDRAQGPRRLHVFPDPVSRRVPFVGAAPGPGAGGRCRAAGLPGKLGRTPSPRGLARPCRRIPSANFRVCALPPLLPGGRSLISPWGLCAAVCTPPSPPSALCFKKAQHFALGHRTWARWWRLSCGPRAGYPRPPTLPDARAKLFGDQ